MKSDNEFTNQFVPAHRGKNGNKATGAYGYPENHGGDFSGFIYGITEIFPGQPAVSKGTDNSTHRAQAGGLRRRGDTRINRP